MPTSDKMVEKELDRLQNLVELFPGATVGHSLGAWWGANLALRPEVTINKLVLWTPLCDTEYYPIFNVTQRYNPTIQEGTGNTGPAKVLALIAKDDLIVPPYGHGWRLIQHFKGTGYTLNGGHFYQNNHKAALQYMKYWIEI
jgi:hypothetical protein